MMGLDIDQGKSDFAMVATKLTQDNNTLQLDLDEATDDLKALEKEKKDIDERLRAALEV